MDTIRYIHAADLHLDAPFQGISRTTGHGAALARLLQEATFTALNRLIRLCEEERPDFLVLAGDIYNHENYSIKAQLALRDALKRLGDSGIPVFLAHGNHDPLDSRLHSVDWPDNVTIFGAEPERHFLEKDGDIKAVIHGISHAKPREGRNLARMFSRDETKDCFQLGILHCALDGSCAERYAPCSLDDLRAAGLDAWALGHVHERAILSESPFIAYSGSTQGLHVHEQGTRGCFCVKCERRGKDFACTAQFRCLGPVAWETADVPVGGTGQLNVVEERINEALDALAADADPACEAIIARVLLSGATELDSLLKEPGNQQNLLERFDRFHGGSPGVWVKDLRIMTRPAINLETYRQRQDLLGYALNIINEMRRNGDTRQSVCAPALKPLFDHSRLGRLLEWPDTAEFAALLDEAEDLCIECLEDHDAH